MIFLDNSEHAMTTLRLGDTAPDFLGLDRRPIAFHAWAGDAAWVVLTVTDRLTPVCTTELGKTALLSSGLPESAINVIAAASASTRLTHAHGKWVLTSTKPEHDELPHPGRCRQDRGQPV
jgi:alkyl hydroperoxide reductase subunit AhpC